MANPVIVDIPKGAWKKVATNVTNGQIIKRDIKAWYLRQYVDSGGSAPTDLVKAVPFLEESLPISASAGIDVYLYCQNFDGKVRVDL